APLCAPGDEQPPAQGHQIFVTESDRQAGSVESRIPEEIDRDVLFDEVFPGQCGRQEWVHDLISSTNWRLMPESSQTFLRRDQEDRVPTCSNYRLLRVAQHS